MDAETQDLLRGSIRGVLAAPAGSAGLGAALAELGWDEVVADDPEASTTILFTEHGRALGASRILDDVFLAEVADRGGAVGVIYPEPGSGGAPTSEVIGDRVRVRGVTAGSLEPGSVVAVPATRDGARVLVTASLADLTAVDFDGFDLDAARSRVSGEAAVLAAAGGAEVLDQAVAAARRAVASEILGVANAALALATEHVSSRRQFGHSIASFQSVRFRLAEASTWLTAAQAAVAGAWGDRSPEAAATAKAYAGQAHRDTVAQCTQVCGAMGVTWEHQLHRFVRRGFMLDALLGSSDELALELGTAFLAGAEIPRLVASAAL